MVTKIFCDTNIILDLLDDKRPFHQDSVAIYQLIEEGVLKSFISESVLTTTDYILRKVMSKKSRISFLSELTELVQILPCSNTAFDKALKSDFVDLEDSLLYQIALENKLHYFITNDVSAIKKLASSSLPVISGSKLLKLVL